MTNAPQPADRPANATEALLAEVDADMGWLARAGRDPQLPARALADLRQAVDVACAGARLLAGADPALPQDVRQRLAAVVEAELALRTAQATWPADPQPSALALARTRASVQAALAEQRRPRRRWAGWVLGGLAAAAGLAAMIRLAGPAPTPPVTPTDGPTPILVFETEADVWTDPVLADISQQLALVEADSGIRRPTSALERLLDDEPLARDLEQLERSTLWEDAL